MASWSGLYDDVGGEPYALLVNRSPAIYHMRRILRDSGLRFLREQFDAAIAASAGEATVKTHNEVTAVATPGENVQGGVRSITTVNDMDNATISAAEVIELLEIPQYQPDPSSYPADASGNGGGGKIQ